MGEDRRYWPKSRVGMVALALVLLALGLALTAGAFALSSALGAATSVVAIAPFVLAFRLLAEATRGRRRMLAAVVATTVGLTVALSLSWPYFEGWDLTGTEWQPRGAAMPRDAEASYSLPTGDPGIPGIYGGFAWPPAKFGWSRGDEQLTLGFEEAHYEGARYVATRVVRVDTRHRFPWEGTQYVRAFGACTGTATYEDGSWSFAFSDPVCAVTNGSYRRLRHAE